MTSDLTVGERIKNARRVAGLTQKELAEMLGVVPSMIGQYETGARNPKIDTIKKLAASLNVSVDFLLGTSNQYSNLQENVSRALFGNTELKENDSLINAVSGLIPILSDLDAISNDGGHSLENAISCVVRVVDGLGDLFLLCADEKRNLISGLQPSRSVSFAHELYNHLSIINEPVSNFILQMDLEIEDAKIKKASKDKLKEE